IAAVQEAERLRGVALPAIRELSDREHLERRVALRRREVVPPEERPRGGGRVREARLEHELARARDRGLGVVLRARRRGEREREGEARSEARHRREPSAKRARPEAASPRGGPPRRATALGLRVAASPPGPARAPAPTS